MQDNKESNIPPGAFTPPPKNSLEVDIPKRVKQEYEDLAREVLSSQQAEGSQSPPKPGHTGKGK